MLDAAILFARRRGAVRGGGGRSARAERLLASATLLRSLRAAARERDWRRLGTLLRTARVEVMYRKVIQSNPIQSDLIQSNPM